MIRERVIVRRTDGDVEGLSDCEEEEDDGCNNGGENKIEDDKGKSDCEEDEGNGDGDVEGLSDCEEWRMMRVIMVVKIRLRMIRERVIVRRTDGDVEGLSDCEYEVEEWW